MNLDKIENELKKISPNINKESLNTFNPVIFVSTLIVPPPLPDVKSLVWNGPIKLICCSALGLPAKNIWFLNISTCLKFAVPVAFTTDAENADVKSCGLEVPVVITIRSVPSKLNILNSYTLFLI